MKETARNEITNKTINFNETNLNKKQYLQKAKRQYSVFPYRNIKYKNTTTVFVFPANDYKY